MARQTSYCRTEKRTWFFVYRVRSTALTVGPSSSDELKADFFEQTVRQGPRTIRIGEVGKGENLTITPLEPLMLVGGNQHGALTTIARDRHASPVPARSPARALQRVMGDVDSGTHPTCGRRVQTARPEIRSSQYMSNARRRHWMLPVARLCCVVAAAVTLAGCIVIPARHYHAPRYYYY